MKSIVSALFCILAHLSIQAEGHPFYVSIVEIHVNEEEKLLECAVKIFTDDLEKSVRDKYSVGVLNIGSDRELDTAAVLIERYVTEHVLIQLNGRKASLSWLGKEGNLEHQWMYFEVRFDKLQMLSINCKQLMEVFPDQRNLVHFYHRDDQKTLIFKSTKYQELIP